MLHNGEIVHLDKSKKPISMYIMRKGKKLELKETNGKERRRPDDSQKNFGFDQLALS